MAKEQYYIDMMEKPWQEGVKEVKLPILEKRIEITSACEDCADLPRVENSGETLVENGKAVQIMHNGLRVLYARYYGSWVNEIIKRLGGVHEPQEERVFHEVLKHIPEGATMIEPGCYWGYYSMWFAKEIPNAKVFMIEPHPRQMKVAQDNFELNGLTGDFTIGYFGSYPDKKKEIQERRLEKELPRYSVEEFMEMKGIDKITVLHSDIQGHEEEMLDGARQQLADRKIDWLFISTHGKRHSACRKILVDSGHRIVAEHAVGQSASADGLLVAQNPDLPEIPPIEISKVEGLVTAHG
ncbi:MAG: FkbM family methyltransferase [Pseudomonadota bacterium]